MNEKVTLESINEFTIQYLAEGAKGRLSTGKEDDIMDRFLIAYAKATPKQRQKFLRSRKKKQWWMDD